MCAVSCVQVAYIIYHFIHRRSSGKTAASTQWTAMLIPTQNARTLYTWWCPYWAWLFSSSLRSSSSGAVNCRRPRAGVRPTPRTAIWLTGTPAASRASWCTATLPRIQRTLTPMTGPAWWSAVARGAGLRSCRKTPIITPATLRTIVPCMHKIRLCPWLPTCPGRPHHHPTRKLPAT